MRLDYEKYDLRARYVAATCAISDATSVIDQHLSVGAFLSAIELQREEDARAILEACASDR